MSERYSTEAIACGLSDVAGWLENDGRYKHARTVRLGTERLRELDAAQGMEARQGRDEGSVEDDSPTRRDAPPSLPLTGEGLPEEIASYRDKIQITFERRSDGGLRVYSDELPGLVLSHAEHAAVLADLRPAIEGLLSAAPSGMAVAASLGRQLYAARARAERAEKALKAILKPFPAVMGSAEDMLEDWMSAVERHRAAARAALSQGEER